MGGRFLPFEISKGQEAFLNQPVFRRLIIFVIFFVATRNLVNALWMSLITILCIGYLFNENSSFCIFKFGIPGSTCTSKENFEAPIAPTMPTVPSIPSMPNMPSMPTAPQGNLTKEETSILNQLQTKLQQSQQEEKEPNIPINQSEMKNVIGMYFKAMDSLQGSKL
jgi:hypothetical protein